MTEGDLLQTVPGTRDILPEEMPLWHRVEDRARKLFADYGFEEIRTPLLEATELFARGIGGETDIVGKEMYTFADASGKSLTLRPEATASVVRAYVQHHMNRASGVTKLYYIGAMFRHEKKQRGRYRQFFQIGAEVLGSDHPAIESEVIEMLLQLLQGLGIETRLLVNSVGDRACRPEFIQRLREAIEREGAQLCEDCRRRAETNPLRVLDCKVESCQPVIARLPSIQDSLCEPCRSHFDRFLGYLRDAGIAYEVSPRLVRGLDYYVRTAFEIVSGELGAQNAVAGGGRYDGLSEVLGGPPAPGFGFALGLDRVVLLMPREAAAPAAPDLYLAYLGEPAFRRVQEIARELRGRGIACLVGFDGGSLRSQLRAANRLRARHVLIIGDTELQRGRYTLRRMDDATQREVSLEELPAILREARERAPAPVR